MILLFPEDESAVNEVTLEATPNDHRATHIFEILKGKPNQQIKVGFLNKGQGLATILSCDKKKTILKVGPLSPSKKSPLSEVTLLIALPRPQTLKKVLETAATFGVGELIFIKTERVEKSFFQSTLLKNESYLEHIYLGLQQGGYTIAPKISFFQDQKYWNQIASHPHKWIAHPSDAETTFLKTSVDFPLLLAVGPEGGWLDDEISLFAGNGFRKISLGHTIHRVENAVCAALAQIELVKG